MSIFLLIVGVLLFIGLVVVHELGHFIAARRNGVEVEEFGIGFPPKIWGRKVTIKDSTFEFTLNALPLGGFVRLKGENDAADEPGTFGAASLSTKVKVMVAGVIVNLVTALGLLTFLGLIGMPQIVNFQYGHDSGAKVVKEANIGVQEVIPGQPLDKAGIKAGDRIISVDGYRISTAGEVGAIGKDNAGETIPVVYERDGQRQTAQITTNKTPENGNGYTGAKLQMNGIELQRSTWSAPLTALGLTKQLTELTFKGLGTAISSLAKGDTKTASEQVSGPVGIAVILNEGSKIGFNFILFIIAILSLSLAIMNVLPIPALDGGRLFVMLLFRALKKPLTKDREEAIHGIGFLALMVLFVLITIVDVRRFF